MYGALWRRLPGRMPGKITGMLVLLTGALALLFFVVFPVADRHLPWNDVTVNPLSLSSVAPHAAEPSSPSLP